VNGDHSTKERQQAVEQFENGELRVLISSNIFNEGISIPAIQRLIIASGGKSKVETLQKLGRGLRVTKDKKHVMVYDFYDAGNVFTERHSKERMKLYKQAGFDIENIR